MSRIRPTLLSGLCLLALVSAAPGIDAVSTNRFVLSTNEVISGELWVHADTVAVAGRLEDNLFSLATGTATGEQSPPAFELTGTVLGDLWAAGENVRVGGAVGRHARLFGFKTVTVSGKVDRNLMALANAIEIDSSAAIQGDCVILGRDIIADGRIAGSANLMGQRVTLAGDFATNVTVTAAEITVMPGTRIGGNLSYLAEKDLVLDSRVTLGGRIIRMEPKPATPTSSTGGLTWQLALYAAALIAALAFTSLFPGLSMMAAHKLYESPWRCVLLGFVTFCLIPMSALVLLLTLIGIPLCVMLLLAYAIVIYFGKLPVALLIGHLVLRRGNRQATTPFFPALGIGLLVLYAVVSLPFSIDTVAWFAITFAGIGALVGAIIERRALVPMATPMTADAVPPPLPSSERSG